MKRRVLFLCATNSLHPLAEGLLRHIDPRNFEAFGASTSCEQLHPLSIEVMKEIGVDLSCRTPKSLEELRDEAFDFIITLDEVTANQRLHVTSAETVHWKFENPLAVSSEPEVQRRAVRTVRDQIAQRLRLFAIVNVRPSYAERTRFAQGQGNPAVQAQ